MSEDLGYLKRVTRARAITNQVIRIPYHDWFITSKSKSAKEANATGWTVTRIGVNQFKCTCPDYQGRKLERGNENYQTRIWDNTPHFYPCKHIIAVCMIERINYMRIIVGEISTDMVYNFNVISGKDPDDNPVEIAVTADGYLIVSGGGGGGGGDASAANQVTQIGQLTDILNAIALVGTEATLSNIETALGDKATEATLEAVRGFVETVATKSTDMELLLDSIEVDVGSINTNVSSIESAIALLGTEATLIQVRDAVQSPTAPELTNAVMLEVPPVDLGTAGTIQAVAFTDIVSLEFKPRSNTTIHYTFDVDGFTNNTFKVLESTGQVFEFGQAGRKYTGNLYLRDPVNDNTLVELAGFF